ncbi:3534_t:CDS:2 [Ambispora gerdemannii]|uniref:3534_t:CDS:1 n=1 Tax=Ambispora gerdemannii TaxID=144530 RepID=A0A9N9ASU4_9GLOM|nr:3534_t:CDS:2 [Ambispora gerdemannii]
MEAIADALAQSDYEIVCLQEVWVYSNFELIRHRTKRRLPYAKFYHSGIVGGGLVILSRYPILEVTHHPYRLNGLPIKVTHGDWYSGKGVASALIDHPVAGVIEVFNTHTHAGYGSQKNDIYLAHRVSQAWEIANLLKNSASRGRNVIAMGDFNSEPDSILHKLIVQHGQVADAWQAQHPSTPASATSGSSMNTWSKNYSSKESALNSDLGKRIDYVFYRKTSRFWCTGSRVVFTDLIPELKCSYSDHFGVEATFTLVGRDKNSVIPLSIWEQAAYDNVQEFEPLIYKTILTLFRQDTANAISNARFQLTLFWISCLLVICGIIIESLIAANVLDALWLSVIILLIVTGFAVFGTIIGLIGFLFGNAEERGFKHIIQEVESFIEGKKEYDSRRASAVTQEDNFSSDRSEGFGPLVEIDGRNQIY